MFHFRHFREKDVSVYAMDVIIPLVEKLTHPLPDNSRPVSFFALFKKKKIVALTVTGDKLNSSSLTDEIWVPHPGGNTQAREQSVRPVSAYTVHSLD